MLVLGSVRSQVRAYMCRCIKHVEAICLHCNKTVLICKYRVKRFKFCSLSCHLKHKNSKRRYENKSGLTYSESYRERRRFKQTVHREVLERDDYTCQICGVRGVDLQVDHIQAWADYVELRFSMDNCRTLCKPCHYEITFGRSIPDPKMPWGHNFDRRMTK